MELRKFPQLRERTRGKFSTGSHAFLHFHEDSGDFFADVKLDGEFRRAKVTTSEDQDELMSRLRTALDPAR